MTMVCPNSMASRSNTARETTSVALPAPNGMKALIGLVGQAGAPAVWAAAAVAATRLIAAAMNAKRQLRIMSVPNGTSRGLSQVVLPLPLAGEGWGGGPLTRDPRGPLPD